MWFGGVAAIQRRYVLAIVAGAVAHGLAVR
jgi:hypothetical protein